MQSLVPGYLDMSIEAFARSQERWRDQMTRTFGAPLAGTAFEEQARQNMAMFEQAMRVWSPFPTVVGDDYAEAPTAGPTPAPPALEDLATLETLKAQMEAMQKQLDHLSRPKKP
jgi:polyhydroxyalkanoate synthesis regulator protein